MQWPYRSTQWEPPAPVLDVRIGGPEDAAEYLQSCEALIDSAADATAIPIVLIDKLGLMVVDSVRVDRGGTSGNEEDIYAAAVVLPVLGRLVVEVVRTEDTWALLGRDILNRLSVLLNGPQGTLDIQS